MSRTAKRLGRGLDSLVSDLRSTTAEAVGKPNPASKQPHPEAGDSPSAQSGSASGEGVMPIDALNPNPYQPRRNTETADVVSLAESIERAGMLQPIVVRVVDGRNQIIAGERRWRAAKSLGMTEVPVVFREANDEQMLEFALIENIQREDLNAIDRALAYRQFCERFDARPEELGLRLGEDRTTVLNYLRLLDLSEEIQGLVSQGKLSMGHARSLLGVVDVTHRHRLARAAVENELSVRALEEIVRREKTRQEQPGKASGSREDLRLAHVQDLVRCFEDALKTKVTIREGRRKGVGKIVINYFSLDDFDRIADALGVTLD